MKKSSIAFVFGTRPEIIKLSPLIRLCAERREPFFLIHSGQHYSPQMDGIFLRELRLPAPRHRLDGRSRGNRHAEHTGRLMEQIESVYLKERPAAVLVQGDTNTVLAAALAAAKMPEIRIGHVEAGLRSGDRRMPEETNRIVADHVSHLLFAPTPGSAVQLKREGIAPSRIHCTGNTIVDALRQNLVIARGRARKRSAAAAKPYALLTLHRQENVDCPQTLAGILRGLEKAAARTRLEIVFPAHPRTVARIREYGLKIPSAFRMIEPVGYFDFLLLQGSADLILTDSGGVQEEACILRIPCVTLRTTTERPETAEVGGNIVAGTRPEAIVSAAVRMLNRPRRWKNPFGDGLASQRILNLVRRDLQRLEGSR